MCHPPISSARNNLGERESRFGLPSCGAIVLSTCRTNLLGLFLVLAAIFLIQSPSDAQVKETRRVLIFNELGLWSPGVNAIDQEIFAALRRSPYQIEIYTEDLDTSLFPSADSQRQFFVTGIFKSIEIANQT